MPIVDPTSGKRVQTIDPETGAAVDAIDDKLKEDAIALSTGQTTDTLSFIPADDIDLRCAVPIYYDHRFRDQFYDAMKQPHFLGFEAESIGTLIG